MFCVLYSTKFIFSYVLGLFYKLSITDLIAMLHFLLFPGIF